MNAATLSHLGQLQAGAVRLPLMGTRICAGFPSPAEDFLDGELDLTRMLAPNRPATFLWRVQGDSVREAGIFDGDIVVVDRSVKPENGKIVVAVINGEVSLKVYRRGNPPRLSFANRDMPAFPMADGADVQIWGVVTWTLHQPRA